MSSAATAPTATVHAAVTINAEPDTVWKFLSEPDRFLAWMTFIPGMPPASGSTFEPHPGGALRIIFPNGGEAKGEVLELVPRKKLVFTWGYDPDVGNTGLRPGSCRVEVSMVTVPEGTRVTLTHSGPMSDALAKGHEAGWRHYLSQLALQASGAHHGAHLQTVVGDYLAAWREPDDARRRALLDRCCEPAVRVRAPFACCDNLDEFTQHIGNGLRHMRGAVLDTDGEVRAVHGLARFPWKVAGPDGSPMFRGESILRLTPAGRIAEITSFHA